MTLLIPDVSKNPFDLNGFCSIVTGRWKGDRLDFIPSAHHGSDLVLVGRRSTPWPRLL